MSPTVTIASSASAASDTAASSSSSVPLTNPQPGANRTSANLDCRTSSREAMGSPVCLPGNRDMTWFGNE